MKPYYEHAGITIYHGDCREILPCLGLKAATSLLVTDPPYGIGYKAPGAWRSGGGPMGVTGDDEPFDPTHLLALSVNNHACIWGANNFAALLPPNHGWIVWDKRLDAPPQTQGDAELAWTNCLGSTRIIRCMWNGGGTFKAENGSPQGYHPTQKPEKVMRRSIELVSDTMSDSVLDPYMGSGTTLIAAKSLGRQATGIEIEERYCEIAAKRLSQEVLPFGKEMSE